MRLVLRNYVITQHILRNSVVEIMLDLLRNLTKSAEEKRRERLNAYVDGRLSSQQQAQVEQELAQDEALRAELAQLRLVQQNLRQLPRRRAPRNFTLDPALYGRPQREPLVQAYPALRLATALTAFFFVLAVALQLFITGSLAPLNEPMAADAGVAQVATEMEAAEGPAAAMAEPTGLVYAPANADVMETETIVGEETMAEEAATAPEAAAEETMEEPAATAPAVSAAPSAAEGAPSVGIAAAATAAPTVTATATATAAPTVATATMSDIPRPAVEDEVANRAATETQTAETAVAATAVPMSTREPETLSLPWLPISLGALLLLLGILLLLARRRL